MNNALSSDTPLGLGNQLMHSITLPMNKFKSEFQLTNLKINSNSNEFNIRFSSLKILLKLKNIDVLIKITKYLRFKEMLTLNGQICNAQG